MLAVNIFMFTKVLENAGFIVSAPTDFGPDGFMVVLTAPDGSRGSALATQSDIPTDPREWLHASIAFTERDPSYAELVLLHKAVFGRRRPSYQVFAPEDEHVNIHDHALHLWGLADGSPVLPSFATMGTI